MLRTLSQHRRHALNLISRVSVGGSLAGRRIPCPGASPSKTTFRFTNSVSNPSGGSSSQSKLLNQINQKNSMDRLYQTFDSVMKEPNTKPSLISNAALLSLASTTLLNASPFASPNLAVSLVSPHPGAVAILDEAVVWTANEINADVVTLDYLEILSLIEEEKRMDQVANLTHSPTIQLPIQPSSITLSSSFRPELYSPAADVGQKTINLDDDIDDEDEFDDDEDAGPPGINARAIFGGMMRGSSSPAVHHHHHQTFPVTIKVIVDGKEVENSSSMTEGAPTSSSKGKANAKTDSGENPDPSLENSVLSSKALSVSGSGGTGRLNRVRVQLDRSPSVSKAASLSGDIWNPRNFKSSNMKLYHVNLRATHVERVMNKLLAKIVMNSSEGCSTNRKVILYYKDATDTLEHGGDSGKRVIAGLLNLVKAARQLHNIPIVLITGCSSSLELKAVTTPGESNPDSLLDFAPFDNSKYARLFTEKVLLTSNDDSNNNSSSSSDEPFNLLQSKALYSSVFDQLPHLFEKIEIPPPFTTPAPTQESTPTLPEVNPQYLLETSRALTCRYIELNFRQLQLHASSRNITLRFTLQQLLPESYSSNPISMDNLSASTSPPPKDRSSLPKDLESLAETLLGHSIWSLDRVRRTVGVALGSQMLAGGVSEQHPGSNVEIGVYHFVEALKVLKEDSWGSMVYAAKQAAALAKADNVGDDADSSGGTSVSVVSATSATKRDDPKGGDGGTSAGYNLNESNALKEPLVLPPVKPVPVESAESASNRIAKQLRKKGHKLSEREVKMLSTVVTPASMTVSFEDLVLPAPTKLMLQTLVSLPLLRPELFQTGILAKHSIAGVLLFGPPGTGKTLLAKAAAKSSGANFLSVSLSDIFDKYVGEGEKNVRAVFTLARKLSPCVVFLDEVDALFSARRGGDSGNGAKREVINEFMAEWDGLHSRNEGVIVLGATNRPFDLDDAILRRMPRRVLVDLPTEAQRLQILQVHLKDELLHESISLADIAKRTALYSGSDLKNVAISAALASVKEHILRESLPSAPENQAEISSAEILKKLESLDDWKSIVNSSAAIAPSTRTTLVTPAKRLLTNLHFEIALKEVPPSLTDEMQTLVELRKWDEKFGDSGALGGKKGKKQGWGFAAGENKH